MRLPSQRKGQNRVTSGKGRANKHTLVKNVYGKKILPLLGVSVLAVSMVLLSDGGAIAQQNQGGMQGGGQGSGSGGTVGGVAGPQGSGAGGTTAGGGTTTASGQATGPGGVNQNRFGGVPNQIVPPPPDIIPDPEPPDDGTPSDGTTADGSSGGGGGEGGENFLFGANDRCADFTRGTLTEQDKLLGQNLERLQTAHYYLAKNMSLETDMQTPLYLLLNYQDELTRYPVDTVLAGTYLGLVADGGITEKAIGDINSILCITSGNQQVKEILQVAEKQRNTSRKEEKKP